MGWDGNEMASTGEGDEHVKDGTCRHHRNLCYACSSEYHPSRY